MKYYRSLGGFFIGLLLAYMLHALLNTCLEEMYGGQPCVILVDPRLLFIFSIFIFTLIGFILDRKMQEIKKNKT